MKKIVNQLAKITKEMMRNISRQLNLGDVYAYVHECSNLIERIRVVDDCSICYEQNRYVLDKLRDVSSRRLFCLTERRVYASL